MLRFAGSNGSCSCAPLVQGEWQGLVARRMQYLGHVQSDYIVSAAEAEAAHWGEVSSVCWRLWCGRAGHCGCAFSHDSKLRQPPACCCYEGLQQPADAGVASHFLPQDGPMGSPWDHSGSLPGSGLFGGGAPHAATPLGVLDDIDYDPDADEAAVAAEAAAAAARRAAVVAAASAPHSRSTSRQPSPRAPTLGAVPAPLPPAPPLPAALLPGLGGGGVPRPQAAPAAAQPLLPAQPGSPLGPQASVVMEDVENDVEFQSMFESKYETGAAAAGAGIAARRSPSIANGSSLPSIGGGPAGASLMAAAAGGGPAVQVAAPSATPALPVKHGSLGGSGSPAGGSSGGGGGVAHSPNTLLPTHISVFGDGLSGLDLRHAAAAAAATAAARHPVQLPSHISEFGGDEDACAGEDAGGLRLESCLLLLIFDLPLHMVLLLGMASVVIEQRSQPVPPAMSSFPAAQCADRDANTMSVMKAALPDDDELLAGEQTLPGRADRRLSSC